MEQIHSAQYAGLQWEDESRTLFRIPWKHAGKQDYNQEVDASIFKVWHQSWRQKYNWNYVLGDKQTTPPPFFLTGLGCV